MPKRTGFRYKTKKIRGRAHRILCPSHARKYGRRILNAAEKYNVEISSVVEEDGFLKFRGKDRGFEGRDFSVDIPVGSADFVSRHPEIVFAGRKGLWGYGRKDLWGTKIGRKTLLLKCGRHGHGDELSAARDVENVSTKHGSLRAPRYYAHGTRPIETELGITEESFTVMEDVNRPDLEEYIKHHPKHRQIVMNAEEELVKELEEKGFQGRMVLDEAKVDEVNPKTEKVRFVVFDLGHVRK